MLMLKMMVMPTMMMMKMKVVMLVTWAMGPLRARSA